MPSEKKAKAVEELKKKLSECTIAIGTDYRGLKVSAMTDLRRALREKGIEYKVVKNTLSYIAADELGRPHIKKIIQGPTGLILGYGNPVEPAKVVIEYIRSTRSALTITGAAFNGRLLTSAEVTTLASLPPKAELVSQLLGQLQAPIANLVTVLNSPIRGMVAVLQRYIEKSQLT